CTGGETFTQQAGTYTFTNGTAEERVLGFEYNLELNGGSASIDGTPVTGPGAFSKVIQANEDVVISITSNEVDHKSTVVEISNIVFFPVANVNITFKAAVNGSYTVNGETITADTVKTFSNTETVALSATASSGYKIFGWKNETAGDYFSVFASLSKTFYDSITVCPEFIENGSPVFKAGNQLFADLNDAVDFAVADSHDVVTLVSSGTLPAGNYTVPAGVTLLLPMDDSFNVVRGVPNIVYGSHSTPSAFRMLTMADGANLTVAGDLSVAGNLSSTGQMGGWNGTPTGPDGRIKMNSGSTITIKSGGNLYCWGYIHGAGSVVAESGATVYEAFQIKDWRGGTATSNVYDYAFILSQYYIQNIEVPLTLYAGATEKLYSSANASSSAYPMGATFVGSGGMFNLTSGYMVKDYIESTDRLQLDFYGNASLTSMTLTGLPLIGSISTSGYILPITSNISVNIHSGTISIAQDVEMLPSCEINIDSGATLSINSGKNVYVYDNDDWGNFTGNARLYVIGYSVANGTTTKRNAAGLVDAKINVNGTLTVAGNIYTSAGGAAIVSDGGGKVVLTKAPGTANSTIYEMAGNITKTSVEFTPAKLQNADGTYVETAGKTAGTEIPYASGEWGGAPCEHSYGEWIQTTDPTCTAAGEETRTCSECGATETRPVDALGHIEVIDPAVAPTCTETGLTEGKHCSRCNEVLVAQEIIPKLLKLSDVCDENYSIYEIGGIQYVMIVGEVESLPQGVIETDYEGVEVEGTPLVVGDKLQLVIDGVLNDEALIAVRGDFDRDGDIDSDDAIYLLRYVMFEEEYPIDQSGDLDNDGDTDSDDAVYMLRHILFKDDYPI
ncbi:MAG: hypothetical protein J6X52_03180, partial [Clostridia bacterium]|nr:hypothetical protein [Clostridia bacterium]